MDSAHYFELLKEVEALKKENSLLKTKNRYLQMLLNSTFGIGSIKPVIDTLTAVEIPIAKIVNRKSL